MNPSGGEYDAMHKILPHDKSINRIMNHSLFVRARTIKVVALMLPPSGCFISCSRPGVWRKMRELMCMVNRIDCKGPDDMFGYEELFAVHEGCPLNLQRTPKLHF